MSASGSAHLSFPRLLPLGNRLNGLQGNPVDLGEDFEGEAILEGLESFFAVLRCGARHLPLEPLPVKNVSSWKPISRWDAEFGRFELRHPDFDELDEMIAMGWGKVPQGKIPANWRTQRGPDKEFSPERRNNVSEGLRRAHKQKRVPPWEREEQQKVNREWLEGEK